jgi:hypothetical protein
VWYRRGREREREREYGSDREKERRRGNLYIESVAAAAPKPVLCYAAVKTRQRKIAGVTAVLPSVALYGVRAAVE